MAWWPGWHFMSSRQPRRCSSWSASWSLMLRWAAGCDRTSYSGGSG